MANANSPQTGLMGSYDAADTTSVVDGTVIFGYQDGDFITWEWDNDRASVAQDSYGTGVISKNNKNGGSITYNLSSESPCNAKFAELVNTGKNIAIDVRTDTEHIYGANAIVVRVPSGTGGDAASVRAWQVKIINMEYERLDSMA